MRKLLVILPLLLAAGCNTRDEGNGTTVISIDENQVDQGLGEAGNALSSAGNEVKQAAESAGPALENAADETGAAAKRAGDTVEGTVRNTDVDVDVTTNEQKR